MTTSGCPPITVGEVEADELQKLLALYQHLHPQDPILKVDERIQCLWQTIQDNPDIHYVVARCQDQVVSSCTMALIPNLTRGARPYGVIENVVTHPDFRRRGIGKIVLHHALQIAWDRNCYKVMLLTGRQDEGTLKFYEQAGFSRGDKVAFMARPPTRTTR